MLKSCVICCTEFRARNSQELTCSTACSCEWTKRRTSKYREKHREQHRKYLREYREANRALLNERRRNVALLKTCVICSGEFSTKRPRDLTCSVKCSRERINQRGRIYRATNRRVIRVRDRKNYEAKKALRIYTLKICAVCNQGFKPQSSNALTCSVACHRERRDEYQRKYRETNSEQLHEQRRKRYVANREQENERTRKYAEANRELIRERRRKYREVNREQVNERKHKYHAANRERTRERRRTYRAANREREREKRRKYREANLERIRERERKYRAANQERVRERKLKYGVAARERIRERMREYNSRETVRNRAQQRQQNTVLAYAALKLLGTPPDHLPTRSGRLGFSYRVLRDHFPGTLSTQEQAE